MKCGICKAEMEEKNVTYTEDIEQGVIVVRHVPALINQQLKVCYALCQAQAICGLTPVILID